MSYKILFIVNAIVVFAFGLLLLVAPGTGLQQFNMDAQRTALYLTRVVGVALASLGLVLFFAKDAEESAQKFLGMAALAGAVLAMIVTLMGIVGASAPVRENGWIVLIVELLFALGYAFVLFLQPRMQQ
ncbi:MAG: hypothetical protein EHM33_11080 [Chloroflexi bacterium]|nr:MAG: hypothetical protein EHM33_11080 [Chloroflexota bacterium]